MKQSALNQPVQGLRGLSILLVFLSHWYAGLLAADLLAPELVRQGVGLFNLGKYGVEIFFMISGFVIVKSLRRHGDVRSFVIDRVARIYPLFLVLHLAVFTAGPLVGHKFFDGVDTAGWIYLFTVNGLLLPGVFDLPLAQLVAWSLSYEVAFYALAVAPMMLTGRSSGWLGRLCWAGWVLVAAGLAWFHPRTLFFLPGVAAALWSAPIRGAVSKLPAVAAVAGLVLFLGLWPRLGLAGGATLGDFGADFALWACCLAGGLGGALFFWHAGLIESWLARLLGSRLMAGFGDLSYSFYLWHLFVIVGLRPVFRVWVMPMTGSVAGFWLFGATALALATMVSWWSRRWLEVRAGDWTKAWLRRCFAPAETRG
jgi:peptidoglycan/LPS O-acetylase OafA/YrhL